MEKSEFEQSPFGQKFPLHWNQDGRSLAARCSRSKQALLALEANTSVTFVITDLPSNFVLTVSVPTLS
jgi:hypothetical protein